MTPDAFPSSSAARVRRGAIRLLVALAVLGGCNSDLPAEHVASSAMGTTPPPPPPITPTLPAPRVEYLGEIGAPDLLSPIRIAVSPQGEIIVSDARGADVHVFSARGTPRARLAGLSRPLGVAAGARGEIYAGDAGDGSVRILARTGQVLGVFGKGAGELAMPNDISVDPASGTVFVADSKRDRVRVFSADGAPLFGFGAAGSAPGQLSFPTGIHLDPAGGRVLVVDHGNARVETFSSAGAYLGAIGSYSGAPGGFVRPQGVARDSLGRLYVADAYKGSVQVLDPNGAFLAYVGTPGMGPGQMTLPSDAVVDGYGRLLVASHDTGKVLVYGIDDWVAPLPDALAATVTIEPRMLRPGSRGRSVTAYVKVSGRDAASIAPAGAILRAGTEEIVAAPRPVTVVDHDGDGTRELELKFSRAALVAALGTPGRHEVAFAAHLTTGEPIEGGAEVILAPEGAAP